MCIVVDTNSMASVFRTKSKDHEEFKPVYDWIIEGKGKLVVGGTEYQREIIGYLGLLTNLAKVNKVVRVCCKEVDKEKERIECKVVHRDYDDPHVVALLSVSKCKLICSKDKRAHPFFKKKELYLNSRIPSIYSKIGHKHLLKDSNIADVCTPCRKLSKSEINTLN